jgi:hypothetical protein
VLGYRDFRFPGTWRKDHPRLVAWLDAFAARVPAFAVTTPAVVTAAVGRRAPEQKPGRPGLAHRPARSIDMS